MRTALQLNSGLLMPALLLALGCSKLGAGVCEHTYRDPVLAITSATDGASGVRVSPLQITAVSVGGQQQPVGYLLATAFGARVVGDTIVCNLPCGFGTSESRYSFTASAMGFVPQVITIDARYSRFEGGCPSYNAGSTRASIALTRSP